MTTKPSPGSDAAVRRCPSWSTARHQVEADARCALGGAAVVAGKALLEHARQVCRTHATAVVRDGKLDALACQTLVQQRTRKHDLCAVLTRIFNAVLNELAQNKLEPLLVGKDLKSRFSHTGATCAAMSSRALALIAPVTRALRFHVESDNRAPQPPSAHSRAPGRYSAPRGQARDRDHLRATDHLRCVQVSKIRWAAARGSLASWTQLSI